MTYDGMIEEVGAAKKVKELEKQLKKLKQDKQRGDADLEKTIDVLETELELKDFEIRKLTDELNELKGKDENETE